LLSFGTDANKNINELTALCGELMHAPYTFYNRLDKDMLCTIGQRHTPPSYHPINKAEGSLCMDVIRNGGKLLVVHNLPETAYAKTDPAVAAYQLQTYFGQPVRFGGNNMGSLCVAYQHDCTPSEDDKKLMGIIAAAIGVEEQRLQANLALADSRERYRAIIEDARVIGWEYDWASERFTYVSGHAREITGYAIQDWYQKGFWADHLHPDDRNTVVALRAEKTKQDKDYELEYRMLAADGSVIWIRDIVHVGASDKGELRLHGIMTDITERQNLQGQLRQSQKMEALGTLVGGIAHDFNNMLAGITGNLYLARRKVEDRPDVVEKLKNIEQLSSRAADMIGQLLAFARKSMVQTQPLSLTAFMKESFKLAQVSIPESIAFHRRICGTDLMVTGDATQLQQVLMNLLSNARDAVAGVDKPAISVKLSEYKADDAFLRAYPGLVGRRLARLTVEDNGGGISEEHLNNIFEPFFTTKAVGNGTGLGLSMVYGSVQSHGGAVRVDSKAGRGTSFHIYLPLLDGRQASRDHTNHDKIYAGHGETILLADDEAHVRETGSDVLESLGYRVLTACDGKEAVKLFCAHRDEVALAILDVVMPHLGGVKAAEQIRRLSPGVPVLFATGYDREQAMTTSNRLPHSLVLTKPLSINKLSRSVRDLINASG